MDLFFKLLSIIKSFFIKKEVNEISEVNTSTIKNITVYDVYIFSKFYEYPHLCKCVKRGFMIQDLCGQIYTEDMDGFGVANKIKELLILSHNFYIGSHDLKRIASAVQNMYRGTLKIGDIHLKFTHEDVSE